MNTARINQLTGRTFVMPLLMVFLSIQLFGQAPSPFQPTVESYGAHAVLNPSIVSEVTLRPQDVFVLEVSSAAVSSKPLYEVTYLGPVTGTSLHRHSVSLKPSATFGTDFTVEGVRVRVRDFVWPGDANADGRQNTLDFFPLAIAMRKALTTQPLTGSNSPPPHANPAQPLTPGSGSSLHLQYLGRGVGPGCEIMLNGKLLSLRHADCNLDGVVDETDADLLKVVLRPMYLPDLLVDQVQGITLNAVMNPNGITAGPSFASGNNQIIVPFDIIVNSVPQTTGLPAPKVVGIVFSRAVPDNLPCTVSEISADFSQSAIITNPSKYLRGQTFWPSLLQWPEPTPCGNLTENVLDVGVFSTDSTYTATLTAGANALTCGVTLEDVMTSQGGSICPVIGAVYNGVGFVYHPLTNSYTTIGFECSAETTYVDVANLKPADYLVRDDANDLGAMPYSPDFSAGSPDLWLRASADGLSAWQNPVPGTTMQVHARAHNQSNKAATAQVDLYWTAGSGNKLCKDAFTSTEGGFIGTVSMELPAHGNAIRSVAWAVPATLGTKGITLVGEVRAPSSTKYLPTAKALLLNACSSRASIAMRTYHRLKPKATKITPADKVSYTFKCPAGSISRKLILKRVSGNGSAGSLTLESSLPLQTVAGLQASTNGYVVSGSSAVLGNINPGTQVTLSFCALSGKKISVAATDRYVVEWVPDASSKLISCPEVVLEVSSQ